MKHIEIREVVNTAVESAVKTAEKDNSKKIAGELKKLGVAKNIISESTGLSEKEIDIL